MKIFLQRDADALDLPLPAYATEGAAGMDLYAALDTELILARGARALVSTGIRLALPDGYEGQVRPRSGLAWRHGLTLLNSPGTIDSDYGGTIKVILINLGQETVSIQRGDRIAQLIIAPVVKVVWSEKVTEALPKKKRGEDGFGSTGY
jgi:dUTP pyrophosphatase